MTKHKRKNLGQSLIEYVALTALVAVVSIGAVRVFGGKLKKRLEQVSTKFDGTLTVGYKNHAGDDDEEVTPKSRSLF